MSHPYGDRMMLDESEPSSFAQSYTGTSSGRSKARYRSSHEHSENSTEVSMSGTQNTIVDSQSSKSDASRHKVLAPHGRGQAGPYYAGKFGQSPAQHVMDDSKMNNGNGNGNGNGSMQRQNNVESKENDSRVVGDYKLGETIGMGGYSKVKLGYHVTTGEQVAIKIMFGGLSGKIDEKTKKHLLREIQVMKTVKHQNVLKLIDYYFDADYPEATGGTRKCVITVLEYAPCGELFDYLMFTGHFGDLATRTYAHQMMDGLHAMHKKGFAHRDLKPENLLLDANYTLKIADFGFSRSFVDAEDIIRHMHTTCGTKGYLAPEVLSRKPYTYKADLFTMGIIIFTTYCAFPPFQEAADTDWWWKHLSKGITYLEKSKKYTKVDPKKASQYTKHGIQCLQQFWDNHTKRLKIDQDFQELMINMLHPSADRRFNHQQIRNHKWYNGRIMTSEELTVFMNSRIDQVSKNRKQKVLQMVADKTKDPKDDTSHIKRTVDNLQKILRTKLKWGLGQSRFAHLMDQIDPDRIFLDNIEYEADMPKGGMRTKFYTYSEPTEIAARLQRATDFLMNDFSKSGVSEMSNTNVNQNEERIIEASVQSYPYSNVTIMNCTVSLKGHKTEKVALKIKQYVKEGTRFYIPKKIRKLLKIKGPTTRTKKKKENTNYNDGDSDSSGSDDSAHDDLESVNSNNSADDAVIAAELSDSEDEEKGNEDHTNEWCVVISRLKGRQHAYSTAVSDLLATAPIFDAFSQFGDEKEDLDQ